jgi:hypothetical protein
MLSSLPLPHFIRNQQGHSKIQLKQEVALVEDIAVLETDLVIP